PMILDMQSYLTSLGGEGNLTLGTPLRIEVDATRYEAEMSRSVRLPRPAQPAEEVKKGNQFGTVEKDRLGFVFDQATQPGLYVFDLTQKAVPGGKPVQERRSYVYNVDTLGEGNLQRIGRDDLENNLRGAPSEYRVIAGPTGWGVELANRQNDLSESAWF